MKDRLGWDIWWETLFSNYGQNPKHHRAKKTAKQKHPLRSALLG